MVSLEWKRRKNGGSAPTDNPYRESTIIPARPNSIVREADEWQIRIHEKISRAQDTLLENDLDMKIRHLEERRFNYKKRV
jgi:hypothetical protein